MNDQEIPVFDEVSMKGVMAFNVRVLAIHSIQRYRNLYYYLNRGGSTKNRAKYPEFAAAVYDTAKFLRGKETYWHGDRIVAIVDTGTAMAKIRQRGDRRTANRYMNFMSALGLFPKLPDGGSLEFQYNRDRKKRPVNVYEIRRWTDEVLVECDAAAARLIAAGITPGNISYNMLCCNGLRDIAEEVFPHNPVLAPDKKNREFADMVELIDALLEYQGYCTKEDIMNNLWEDDQEIKKLFRIFKSQIQERYQYKRPSEKEKKEFGLPKNDYIYIRRINEN